MAKGQHHNPLDRQKVYWTDEMVNLEV